MSVQARLQALGITLPPVSVPAAAYVPFVRTGQLVFLSGHIARRDGKPWVGQLGLTMATADTPGSSNPSVSTPTLVMTRIAPRRKSLNVRVRASVGISPQTMAARMPR